MIFIKGKFLSHSGFPLPWKIDVDSLGDMDFKCLAWLGSRIIGPFSEVEGIPRGGLRFAQVLQAYKGKEGPKLIVDDVLTTGKSMENARMGMPAKGLVIFNRGIKPPWVESIFQLNGNLMSLDFYGDI